MISLFRTGVMKLLVMCDHLSIFTAYRGRDSAVAVVAVVCCDATCAVNTLRAID